MCSECGGEYGHLDWCPVAKQAKREGPLHNQVRDLKAEVERWQKRALLAEARLEESQFTRTKGRA